MSVSGSDGNVSSDGSGSPFARLALHVLEDPAATFGGQALVDLCSTVLAPVATRLLDEPPLHGSKRPHVAYF
jgi:hypothetical protein